MSGPQGPEKKKTWGREQNVCVRTQGATQKGHPLQTKGSWRNAPGSRGAGEITQSCPLRRDHLLGLSRKSVAANATEGENKNHKREAQKHPCRLASKKGPRNGRAGSSPVSSRRIQKTRGAQNGTPRKHQEAGRTAKKAIKQTRRDKKKKTKPVRVGVSCYYLIFVS